MSAATKATYVHGPKFGILGVYAIIYLAFVYIPVLFLPLFSFNDSIYIAFPLKGFTFEWYGKMANSPGLLDAMYNSIQVAAIVSVIATVMATLAAKAVTRYRLPGRGPIVAFIMIPLVIPGIILGIALLVVANFSGLGLSLITIGIGHSLVCVPFAMLVMISRLEGFDKNLEEASLDLGEGAWMTFWRVTFPLIQPGIAAGAIFSFVMSFDNIPVSIFLTDVHTNTIPIAIMSYLEYNFDPSIAAVSSMLIVGSLALGLFLERIFGLRRAVGM